jgi:uncharacterized protein (TIGR03083 family)
VSDTDRSITAWSQTLDTLLELGDGFTDDQWTVPTECPEWTVKDIYSHLVGGEEWMAQGHPPPAEGLARIADGPVAARHDRTGPEVLAELRAVYAHRLRQLVDNPPDPDVMTQTAFLLPVTVGVLLRMRAFDAWVHEQDVRRAVAAPGGLATTSAEIARDIFLTGLPRVVAKLAAAPPGSVVRFTVHGDIQFDLAVSVDGSGRGHPAAAEDGATATLAMSWETFTRLAAGRIAPDAAAVQVSGDRALADRVLSHFAVTP